MKRLIYISICLIALGSLNFEVKGQACANPATTPYNTNNGQDGIMFTITAKRNIVIDSFDNNYAAGTISQIRIYYKPGEATGYIANAAAWTLLGTTTGNITSSGVNNATRIPLYVNLAVPKYQTVAFYITTNGGTNPICRYTNGTGVCDSLGGNGDLVLHEGYGKDFPFAASFSPREFNGRVYYHCANSPATTIAGNLSFCNVVVGQQETYFLSPPFDGEIYWQFPSGMTQIAGGNNDTVTVQFSTASVSGQICAAVLGCGGDTAGKFCETIISNPPQADAGPDTSICGTPYQMQGNLGSNGVWTVISGSGTFANANVHNTTVSGLSNGLNTFQWTIGGNGCPVSSDVVNITLLPQAIANFNNTDICEDYNMPINSTSYALGGNITSWSWDVDGNGTQDYTTSSVSHNFNDTGNFQCELIVTSNGGCMDTVVKTVRVHPKPEVYFTFDPECELTATPFTDQSSIGAGSMVNWLWYFGDGSTSNTQNTTHVYQSDGVYLASLQVTSNVGCVGVAYDSIEVFTIPDAMFDFEAVCQNDTLYVEDKSTSIQGNIVYWEWDFDDATPLDYNQNTIHTFAAHGPYDVELLVATDKGCTNTVVNNVEIYPVPIPIFAQDFECEKQLIRFRDSSSLDNIFNSTLVKWDWDFGDGNAASNQTVGNFYQEPGYYTVTHTPYSNYGCFETVETEILVRPQPEAIALIKNDRVCAGKPIDYQDESYFDYTYDDIGIVEWTWFFGDGNTAGTINPSNTFTKGGDYKTRMIVETSYHCIDSTEVTTVVYHNPIARFEMDSTEGCSPVCVTFFDKSKVASGDSMHYAWTFGDNTGRDEVNPTHCYSIDDGLESKEFFPELLVTTINGCANTSDAEESIIVYSNPIADFDINPTLVTMLDPVVDINNYSEGGTNWYWNFGDSATSFDKEPFEHSYTDAGPGVYTISLETSTDFGCKNQALRSLLVNPHQTLYIPKSFTPNADGVNDVFEIKGEDLEFIKIAIYDRWGKELFYGENENAVWDGRANGQLQSIGTYTYVLEYKQSNKIKEKLVGNLIISATDIAK